jgi:hypothetical protein
VTDNTRHAAGKEVMDMTQEWRWGGGNALRAAIVALTACTVLSGCAQQAQHAFTGPIVTPDDTCSQYRQPIADIQRSGLTPQDMIAPAIGAVGGAIAGGLIASGGRGFDTTGAIIGGLVGAAAGVGARYVERVRQQNTDQQALARAIYNDDLVDGQRFSTVRTAVVQLRECRRRQFTTLATDTRANRIPRARAQEQFQLLISRRERDDEIVNAALGTADQRVSIYRDAATNTQTREMIAAMDAQSKAPPTSRPGSGARVQPAVMTAGPVPLTQAVDQLRQQEGRGREEQRRTEEALRTLLI